MTQVYGRVQPPLINKAVAADFMSWWDQWPGPSVRSLGSQSCQRSVAAQLFSNLCLHSKALIAICVLSFLLFFYMQLAIMLFLSNFCLDNRLERDILLNIVLPRYPVSTIKLISLQYPTCGNKNSLINSLHNKILHILSLKEIAEMAQLKCEAFLLTMLWPQRNNFLIKDINIQ